MIKKHRIQEIPIGKSPETDTKFKDITSQTSIQAFYTDENSYFIKKSNYGNGVCSSVDFLPPARVFTTEINAAERERLEEQVRDAASTKSGIEQRLKVRRTELNSLEESRAAKEEELSGAKKKVEYKKQLVGKIAQAKRGKEQLERNVPDLQALRQKAQKDTWVIDYLLSGFYF
jgi:DNA repair exonuclease SbcCD ATPase subunit